ncbi:hypothetical protein [Phenylobacterium sp.]|uniref:hypothetical protein n=1 Tax=Phenylobacterium sp. TaxID=1871053 RepID=UPI0035B492B4
MLVRLRALADTVASPHLLGAKIVAATDGTDLEVAREAALVVLDETPPATP